MGGSPGRDSKVSDGTAENFERPKGDIEVLSPLEYNGRQGGNPHSPASTGINPDPDTGVTGDPITPHDPLGILDTITGGATSRGKRGGAYGK